LTKDRSVQGLRWVLGEDAEELVPPAPAVTVSELCSLYLAAKEESPKPPSPRTLKDDRQYVRDHVDSNWFGSLPADESPASAAHPVLKPARADV